MYPRFLGLTGPCLAIALADHYVGGSRAVIRSKTEHYKSGLIEEP
jgi:hypothetical protein